MLSFEGTDSIDDFEDGQDLLKLPEAIYFTDVQIIQGQGENAVDTLINFQSETLAILSNLDSEEISHSDFVLI